MEEVPVSQLSQLSVREASAGASHYESNSNCLAKVPAQVERAIRRKGTSFTLMVVGESGLGKSTFIRTMFGREFTVNKLAPRATHRYGISSVNATVGANRSPEVELAKIFGIEDARSDENNTDGPSSTESNARSEVHPTAEIEVYQASVTEGAFTTNLTVIDTPGFGDYTNNENTWVPVANYIDSQHQYYMLQEEQPDRTHLIDTRVHVCVYFLAPTGRVLELDLKAMRELCTRVNLVPVIAKADSITPEDLIEFKRFIRQSLADNNIHVWTPETSTDKAAIESSCEWPYAVVSSDSMVLNSYGERVRGREYRWGTIEIENPEHSDFVKLRNTLFRDHMLSLIDTTTSRHYNALRKKLRVMRVQRAMGIFDYERQSNGSEDDGKETNRAYSGVNGENSSQQLLQQQLRQNHRLAPQDRASLGFLSGTLIPTKSAAATHHGKDETAACHGEDDVKKKMDPVDITEEVITSMGAIETLSVISKFGSSFLNAQRNEDDVLFLQRAQCLKAQFEIVARFQEDRFDAEAAELEHIRNELNNEILRMNEENKILAKEIADMEALTKKRK